MELTDSPAGQHSGGIFNYFQGATIHNLVINGNMSRSGTEHYHAASTTENTKQDYTDEKIARAITTISGEGKPLSLMKHYVGVICALQSMGWSPKFATCCARINQLPGHEHYPVRCDSNAIKSTQALKFASVDYNEWATYQPKAGEEEAAFKGCKFAADSFVEVLTEATE
jgi:hypothetical protein